MTNIKSMADKSNNAMLTSPENVLKDALKEVQSGKLKDSKKLIVLALDDSDCYDVRFMQAGMKMSECVALCEVAKTMFLTEMEYISE